MRKILLALLVVLILGIGIVGYNGLHDEPTEVIEEKGPSTKIEL